MLISASVIISTSDNKAAIRLNSFLATLSSQVGGLIFSERIFNFFFMFGPGCKLFRILFIWIALY
ncbi:hypothetical protein BLHB2_13150 [Bacillus licheniformis]|nr:hypothetical protein BLHB2_13150 [Bacillus licheniformis]